MNGLVGVFIGMIFRWSDDEFGFEIDQWTLKQVFVSLQNGSLLSLYEL